MTNTATPKRGRGVRIDAETKAAILADLNNGKDPRTVAVTYTVSLPTVYKIAKTDPVGDVIKRKRAEMRTAKLTQKQSEG
jgi:hypothetical protein